MKELWRKKSVKAAFAAVVILAAVVIVSISAQSFERKRNYNGHIDSAEKYLAELNYEQAIVEYTLALEIEPNSKEILDALEETYLAYAQTYADIEEYESAIEILEKGYAQTGGERLQAKIEELTNLRAQKEEEERLLAEEAEKQRMLEEEAKRQRLLAEAQEKEETADEAAAEDVEEMNEETSAPEQEQEESTQATEESDTLAAYQAKAAEYAFSVQREFYENNSWGPLLDARSLKTQVEFCEYFDGNPDADFQGEIGAVVGAVNTSILEETDTQCRILVSDIDYTTHTDTPFGYIVYFEFVIDKTTGQGTIADFYYDVVYVTPEPDMPILYFMESYVVDKYNCKGKVFDFNE